jgi:hypothetical protein
MRAISAKLSGLPLRRMGAPVEVMATWFIFAGYPIILPLGIAQFAGKPPDSCRAAHDSLLMT